MALPEPSQQPLPTTQTTRRNVLRQKSELSGLLIAFAISLLLVALLALLFGQRIGYQRALGKSALQARVGVPSEALTASNVKALNSKIQTLQTAVANAQQERDISLSNLDGLREDLDSLRLTNLQVQQQDEFLIKELAKRGGADLQLIGIQIAPLPENAFEYRFDVGMVDRSGQTKKLTPKLTLLDDINMVEVPIEPASYDINGVARVRGRFIMPKDFKPKQIKVELAAAGQNIEQVYDWQEGERLDNLPYSLAETPNTDDRPIQDSSPAASGVSAASTAKP